MDCMQFCGNLPLEIRSVAKLNSDKNNVRLPRHYASCNGGYVENGSAARGSIFGGVPSPAFKDKLIFTHLLDSGDGGDGTYDYGAMFYLDKW